MNRLKAELFRFLGKEPEAVVVSFCSGPPDLAARMVAEVRALVPDRHHFAVSTYPVDGVATIAPADAPEALRTKRIGLAPTLLVPGNEYRGIRLLAQRMAPLKILAYNAALERHHLQLTTPIATYLFLEGVPLDRIWLRPKWFPFRREHSTWPDSHIVVDGRPTTPGRRRVAVLSPYFPWPLSHGGAVRIYNLLREAAKEFDIYLFAFSEDPHRAAHKTAHKWCCSKIPVIASPAGHPSPRRRFRNSPRNMWATSSPLRHAATI
jgi:hypothetical protein